MSRDFVPAVIVVRGEEGVSVLIDQAIFTSVRSRRNDGYQLVASSSGVTNSHATELTQWGPGHDSIYETWSHSPVISFHQMDSDLFCVSRTVHAGPEHSGRRGERVFTHSFLVPTRAMARFANNPIRIVEALSASGRLTIPDTISRELPPVNLLGRTSLINTSRLEELNETLGADRLATLVCAAQSTTTLGVSSSVSPVALFACLFDLFPPPHRLRFSFTTGLRVSSRRPYRICALPQDAEEQRRAIRLLHLTPLDLYSHPGQKYAPHRGWPLLIHRMLQGKHYHAIESIVHEVKNATEEDPDMLAEQVRETGGDSQSIDLLNLLSG